jgi:hypothetical protein
MSVSLDKSVRLWSLMANNVTQILFAQVPYSIEYLGYINEPISTSSNTIAATTASTIFTTTTVSTIITSRLINIQTTSLIQNITSEVASKIY